MSGQQNKVSERGALTFWRVQTEGHIKTAKQCERVRDTDILETQKKGQVRTSKQSERARGTHCLENREVGRSQDNETKQRSKGLIQTGEHRGKYKSG
jgi:hypothetical protein